MYSLPRNKHPLLNLSWDYIYTISPKKKIPHKVEKRYGFFSWKCFKHMGVPLIKQKQKINMINYTLTTFLDT